MRSRNFTILALSALLAGSPVAFAKRGGIGDGGGGGIGSKPEDVAAGVRDARLALGVYLHLAANDPLNPLQPAHVGNAAVKKVLESWLAADGDGEAIVKDSLASEYRVQKEECPSDTDDDHDASTAFRRGAVICFSTDLLKRYPAWTLPAELVALAAHEHAHHFGFGEEEARAVQRYVFDAYGLLRVHELVNRFLNVDTGNFRARVKLAGGNAAGEAGFVKSVCRDFYQLQGQALALNVKAFALDAATRPVCDPASFDPDAVDQRLRDLMSAAIKDLH
jgi:hypothetical protein